VVNALKGKILSGRVYPEFFPFEPGDRVVNIGSGSGPQAVVYRGKYRQMVGLDITFERLKTAQQTAAQEGIRNFQNVCADVERLPLKSAAFDKAIAIDIIEHVRNPRVLCLEAHRVLKSGGKLLVTFPALHDHYVRTISRVARLIRGKKQTSSFDHPQETWHPDAHNQEFALPAWIALVEESGFRLLASRASTLFPPLHLYGVPRFWFSSDFIHRIDSYLCSTRLLKNYGQALVCAFEKTA
jgi:SAM-dependent methyltransferase